MPNSSVGRTSTRKTNRRRSLDTRTIDSLFFPNSVDISLVSCVLFVALCRFVGIVESIRSATERFRDIRFYRPSISLRWYILSRQNPGRPVSSDKNLSRGRTTRGRLADAPTVVPASICSTRAGSARSTALFLSIVPDDLSLIHI